MTTAVDEKPVLSPIGVAPAFDEVALPYRTLSRSAIMAAVLAAVSSLGFIFPPLLLLAAVGLVLGVVAWTTIRCYPNEYIGKPVAMLATFTSLIILTGGTAWHIYDYSTEVPDGYERVTFSELQPNIEKREYPVPKRAFDLQGKPIFIKGYIHPGVDSLGRVTHFVLVPDMGTCCFGGQPKMTDMVEVKIVDGAPGVKYSTRRVKLAGKFALGQQQQEVIGLKDVVYHLEANHVKQ